MRFASPLALGFTAAVLLAGCSGAGQQSIANLPTTSGSVGSMASGHQVNSKLANTMVAHHGVAMAIHHPIADKKGKGSVYVTDYGANVLYGYPAAGGSPTFVATSGLSGPQGAAATKKNVYVANTNDSQILVYQPPSTTPVLTVNDANEFPAGVAVNKKGSQIWVSNICSAPSCGGGNLQEYDGSGNLQQTITCSNLSRYYFLAVDKKGDVIVDGQSSAGSPAYDLVPAGSSSCTALNSISVQFPGGLAFTSNGDIVVDDQDANTETVYGAPNFDSVVSTTTLSSTYVCDPVTIALAKGDGNIWSANACSGTATAFTFPTAGSTPVTTLSGIVEPIGVAVQPPAKT